MVPDLVILLIVAVFAALTYAILVIGERVA